VRCRGAGGAGAGPQGRPHDEAGPAAPAPVRLLPPHSSRSTYSRVVACPGPVLLALCLSCRGVSLKSSTEPPYGSHLWPRAGRRGSYCRTCWLWLRRSRLNLWGRAGSRRRVEHPGAPGATLCMATAGGRWTRPTPDPHPCYAHPTHTRRTPLLHVIRVVSRDSARVAGAHRVEAVPVRPASVSRFCTYAPCTAG
jgi:hypothetical protein